MYMSLRGPRVRTASQVSPLSQKRICVDKLNSNGSPTDPGAHGCRPSSEFTQSAGVRGTPYVEFIRLQEKGFDLPSVASSGATRLLTTFPVCDSVRQQHAWKQNSMTAGPSAGTSAPCPAFPCNVSYFFRFSGCNSALRPAGHPFRSFQSY